MAVTIYNGEYKELNNRKQAGFFAGKTSLSVENDTTRANTEIRIGFVEYIQGTSHTMRVAAWSVSDIEDVLNIRDYRIEYNIEFTYSGNSYTISGNSTGTVNSNIKYCPDLTITINDSNRGKKFNLTVTKVSCKLFQKKLFGSSYDRAGAVSFTGSGTASVTTATSVDLTYLSSSTGIILKTVSGTPTKPLTQNYDTINSDDGHYQYSDWTSDDTGQSAPKGTTIYPGDRIYSGNRVLLKYNLTLRYNSKITTNTSGQSMVLGEFTPQQRVTLPTESELTFTLDSNHMILGVTDINRNGNWLPNGATKFALGSSVRLDVQTSDSDKLFIHLVVIDKNIEYNVTPKIDSASDLAYRRLVNFPYPDTDKQYTCFGNVSKVKYGDLIKSTINDIFIDNIIKQTTSTLLMEYCPEITLHNNGEGSYAKDNIQLVASLVNVRGSGVKSYCCTTKYNPLYPYFTIVGLVVNAINTSTYVVVASQNKDYCKLYCDGEESTSPVVKIEGTGYYVGYHHLPQANGSDTSPFNRRKIGTYEVSDTSSDDPLGSVIQQVGNDLLHQRSNKGYAIGSRRHNCFRDVTVVPANITVMSDISNIKSEGVWRKGLLYKKIDGVWRQLLPFQKSGGDWSSLGRKFAVDYPSTGIRLVDPSDKYFRLNMYNHGKDVSSYWIQVSDSRQKQMPEDYFISRNQALSYVYIDSPITVESGANSSGIVIKNRDTVLAEKSQLSIIPEEALEFIATLKNEIINNLIVTIIDNHQEKPYQFRYESGQYYQPGISDESQFWTEPEFIDLFNESSKVQADIDVNFALNESAGKVVIIYSVKLLSSDIDLVTDDVSCQVALGPNFDKFTLNRSNTRVEAVYLSDTVEYTEEVSSEEVTDRPYFSSAFIKRFDDLEITASPFHYDSQRTHSSEFLTLLFYTEVDRTDILS